MELEKAVDLLDSLVWVLTGSSMKVTTEQVFDFLDEHAFFGWSGNPNLYCEAGRTRHRNNKVVVSVTESYKILWMCFDCLGKADKKTMECYLCQTENWCFCFHSTRFLSYSASPAWVCEGCVEKIRGELENWRMVKILES